jgi:hypothetical protein
MFIENFLKHSKGFLASLQGFCFKHQPKITHPFFIEKSYLSRRFIEYSAFYVRLYKENY